MRVRSIVSVASVALASFSSLFGLAACDRLSPPSERAAPAATPVAVPERQAPDAQRQAPPSAAAPTAATTTFSCGKVTCRSDEVCCSEACGVCTRAGTVCPQKIECPPTKAATPPPGDGKGDGVKCGYDVCPHGQICCPSGCSTNGTCD